VKLLAKSNKVKAARRANEDLIAAYERIKDEASSELQEHLIDNHLAGTSLSTMLTRYRVDVLEKACFANMSMGQLGRFKPGLDLKESDALNIGCAQDLPRTVGKALKNAQEKKLKWIMSQCYPIFGTTSDGSPLGANAEALQVRMVKADDHRIIDLLISVRLFKASLTGENIAAHMLSELGRFDLEQANWRPAMMDRAAANTKALAEVVRLTDYTPTGIPCQSHTFSLPGKEFYKSCSILHQFRKAFNKAIMFRGKLYLLVKQTFMVTPAISGGVRWYLEWEQIAQMDGMGITRLAIDIVAQGEK